MLRSLGLRGGPARQRQGVRLLLERLEDRTLLSAVTGLSPASGPASGGAAVQIFGSGFIGTTSVTFGGTVAANYSVTSDTMIYAQAPAHAGGVVDVVVTSQGTASPTSAADHYTYSGGASAPAVSGLSPSSGAASGGTMVQIFGSGFTGAAGVSFGGTAAGSFNVVSDTQINAAAPTHVAGSVDVIVTNPAGASSATANDHFTYTDPAPTVTGLSASTGTAAGGAALQVSGSGFTGTTSVSFGGAAAGFSVTSDGVLAVTAPAHAAGMVDVIVVTSHGTSSAVAADHFTYMTPVPAVTGLAASSGSAAGGTALTITGTGFTGATSVSFGGTAATSYSVVSDSQISATAPAHAAGIVDVIVTAPAGSSGAVTADQFSYNAVPPAVSGVSPPSGSVDGAAVQITGTGFTGATAVSFGGIPATGFTVVSDSQINVTAPAHASGAVDVTVTTPAGVSATSAADRFTYVAAADLAVTLSGPAAASPGDQIAYTLTVANNGPDDAFNVVLSTALPAGAAVGFESQSGGSASFTTNATAGSVVNTIADLASGAAATFLIGALAPADAADGAALVATASVTSDSADANPANNTASVTTTVSASAPITVTNPGPRSGAEGGAASLQIQATGGGVLTYGAQGLPAGLGIDPASGLISGTVQAGAAASGPYFVTVTAADASQSASQSFWWDVAGPVALTNPGDQSGMEGNAVSLQIQAGGANGLPLSYSVQGLPAGLSIDPASGLISGALAAGTAEAGPYEVTVTAGDGSASASQSFQWDVVAEPPLGVVPPGDQVNAIGDVVSLQLSALDAAGAPLTYSAPGLPDGLGINPATGLISGTVAADAARDTPYVITAAVTDGVVGASLTFQWTVQFLGVANPGDQSGYAGDAVSLQIHAAGGGGQPATFAATGLPAGLGIDPTTGLISGTIDPAADAGGPYTTTVTATAGGHSAGQSFAWAVAPQPLTLDAPGDQANTPGDAVSLQLTAQDAAGDAWALTFSVTGLPDGLSADPLTGLISGAVAPDALSATPYQVTAGVTDGTRTVSRTFAWQVAPVVLANPGDQINADGDAVSLQIQAHGTNGAPLTFAATGLPGGLSIDPQSGLISGTLAPAADANGPCQTTVTASDGVNAATVTLQWNVNAQGVSGPPAQGDPTAADGTAAAPDAADAPAPSDVTDPLAADLGSYVPSDMATELAAEATAAASDGSTASDAGSTPAPAAGSPDDVQAAIDQSAAAPASPAADANLPAGASTAAPTQTEASAPVAAVGSSMLPSDGSPPAALAPNASTPQASSVLTPLSAASGAAPAAASITAATYTRHYTGSGGNATDSFYVDVTITESYGPTDQSPTPVDQGTVSYTAWMKHLGRYVYNVTNAAVPINAGGPMALGYTSFGEMTAGGVLSDLGFSTGGWDHAHWSETITRTAAGTVAGAGGAVYLFASRFTQSDWRDVVGTAPPAAQSLSPSTTVTYGGQSASDAAVSDVAANLPTGAAAGAGGRPTGLFDAPAAGTTYLVRSFDSETWKGTDRTTHTFGPDGYPTGTGLTRAFGYSGADGYRDFENVTTRTGATTDPSYDTLTRQVDYQREGSYGGSQSYNLTGVGMLGLSYNGSETTEQYDSGKVLRNVSDNKDVYHHTSGVVAPGSAEVVSDGMLEVKLGDGGKASTYSDDLTLARHFDLTGALNSDVLTYDQRRAGDATTAVSDTGVSKAYGGQTSPTTGGLVNDLTTTNTYVSSTDRRHEQSDNSGDLDLLDHTGTVDVSGSYTGSDRTVNRPTVAYVSADGTFHRYGFSAGVTTGDYSGTYAAQGDVDASGNQIDGTSSSYKENTSDAKAAGWTEEWGAAVPTKTTIDASGGDTASWSRSALTYNPDGTADGAVTGASDVFNDDETTVTTKGTYDVPGGTASADDLDHRTTKAGRHTSEDLTLNDGLPTGAVHSEVDLRTDYDHYLHHTLDMDDGSLHAVFDSGDSANDAGSSGTGFSSTTDVIDALFCSGDLSATRTFDFEQRDDSGSKLTASGNLSDANGHTGSWTFNETTRQKTGAVGPKGIHSVYDPDAKDEDHLSTTSEWQDGAWKETGRTTSFGDASDKTTIYHQEDNGLGEAADNAAIGETHAHTQDVNADVETLRVFDGNQTDYTFASANDQGRRVTDSRTRTWKDGQGNSGTYTVKTVDDHSQIDEHRGSAVGGAVVQDRLVQDKSDSTKRDADGKFGTPQTTNETHSRDEVFFSDSRNGDAAPGGVGSGHRNLSAIHRYWWVTVDNTAPWPLNTTRGGTENAPAYSHEDDLSWGHGPKYADLSLPETLWQDFVASPEGVWWAAHWGDVLRVVGGSADVVFGVTMSLGSGGLAIFPGVGLMAVGIDQVYAGAAAIATGQRDPSVIEFLGATGAQALGATPATAQTVGALTPGALSLLFTIGGGLLTSATPEARAAAAAAQEEKEIIQQMQADVDAALQRLGPDPLASAPGDAAGGVPWEYGTPGTPGARNAVPWQYGNLVNAYGETDALGNITIQQGLTGPKLIETIAHESVHRFLSPLRGPMWLRQIRGNLLSWGYDNSHLLAYMEEAIAQGYATGNLWKGLAFPITYNYVSLPRVLIEGIGYITVVGGAGYGAYRLADGVLP